MAVFDLSRRNVLCSEVVNKVLDNVYDCAQDPPPEETKSEFSDFWRNAELLRSASCFGKGFRSSSTVFPGEGITRLFVSFRRSHPTSYSEEATHLRWRMRMACRSTSSRNWSSQVKDDSSMPSVPDLTLLTSAILEAGSRHPDCPTWMSDEWDHAWGREVHALTATQTKEMEMRRRRLAMSSRKGARAGK